MSNKKTVAEKMIAQFQGGNYDLSELKIKSLNALRKVVPQTSPFHDDYGKTGIWLILEAARSGHIDPFDYLVTEFGNELTLDDFKTMAKAPGDMQTVSGLFLSVVAAWFDPTPIVSPLTFIFENFATALTMADFKAEAAGGIFKGQSPLGIALAAWNAGQSKPIEKLLKYVPGPLKREEMLFITSPNVKINNSLKITKLRKLVMAKNRFFSALQEYPYSVSRLKLSELAKEVKEAGFENSLTYVIQRMQAVKLKISVQIVD